MFNIMLAHLLEILWLEPLSVFIASAIIIFTMIMWSLGRVWSRGLKYPPKYEKGEEPKVTVVISSYKSEKTIEETLKSVLNDDYENREIIVVDDTPDDSVVRICKKYPEVKVFHNAKREGKARSLNKAIKSIKTDLFLFLDSDSIIRKGFMSKLARWFRDEKVGAVSPRFDTKNRKSFLGILTSLESSFWFTLSSTHMFFGSMISFRGCGVMIRASVMKEVGYWDETLVEDMALAGKILRKGYIIAHDPKAIVYTEEPETVKELYKQRFRWGKGGFFAFMRNKDVYLKLKQVLIVFIPHATMIFILICLVLFNSILMIYAMIPFSNLSSITIGVFFRILILLSLLFSAYWIPASIASLTHALVFSARGLQAKREVALLIPYLLLYVPLVFSVYALGILAGIKKRIKCGKNLNELDVKDWKK